jgi:two-component system response regulator FixJ
MSSNAGSEISSHVGQTRAGRSDAQSPLYQHGTVYLVDDHEDFLETTALFLRQRGYRTQTFASATAFLAQLIGKSPSPRCLVTDLRMPEMDGLTLQERLQAAQVRMPIIFVSGSADLLTATQAMRHGACDFLEKPFAPELLEERIAAALAKDAEHCKLIAEVRNTAFDLRKLTPREREVLELMANAASTKEIAAKLGINSKTVFVHRARVLEKMGVDNPVALSQVFLRYKANSNGTIEKAEATDA